MLNLGQDEQCGKPISLPLGRGYTVDESHYSVLQYITVESWRVVDGFGLYHNLLVQ